MTNAATRALIWIPALAWASLIFYLSGQAAPPQPPGTAGIPFIDKAQHMIEYGILSALLLLALRRSPAWAARFPARWDPWIAAGIAAAYGATDELHQMFVPARAADVGDWVFDALGAALVALALSPHIGRRPMGYGTSPGEPASASES